MAAVSWPVTEALTFTQPRCRAPDTLPPCSTLPPSARTWSSSSRAAVPQYCARFSSRLFSLGSATSSAALVKPFSPSLDVSINSFTTDMILCSIAVLHPSGLDTHTRNNWSAQVRLGVDCACRKTPSRASAQGPDKARPRCHQCALPNTSAAGSIPAASIPLPRPNAQIVDETRKPARSIPGHIAAGCALAAFVGCTSFLRGHLRLRTERCAHRQGE